MPYKSPRLSSSLPLSLSILPVTAMGLSPNDATLISICAESICYGIYLVLFWGRINVLVRKSKDLSLKGQTGQRHSDRYLQVIVVSIIMFTIATLHIIVDLVLVISTFVFYEGSTIGYLENKQRTLQLVRTTAYTMQTIISDGFMLNRLYRVWNKDKRLIAFMSIFLLASLGIAITILVFGATVTAASSGVAVDSKQRPFILSFIALALVINVTCTSLIAGRIRYSNAQVMNHVVEIKGRTNVLTALTLSGAIYSILLILLMATYASSSSARCIFFDAAPQVIGIVVSVITTRNYVHADDRYTDTCKVSGKAGGVRVLITMEKLCTVDNTQKKHETRRLDDLGCDLERDHDLVEGTTSSNIVV